MAGTPTSPARRPHFFKVLLHGFSKRLRIPPAFIKHIKGGREPRRAEVLSPLGRIFHVEIEGDMEALYFGAGWQQFASAHDLDFGYFLVFRYDGDLVFHVQVFDHTGCQKEYDPVERDVIYRRKTESRRTRNSSRIVEEISEGPVTRSCDGEAAQGSMRPQPAEVKKKKMTSMLRVMAKTAAPGTVTPCGNSRNFKTVIMPSHLTKYLNLPIAFWTKNEIFRTQSEVVLRDPEGRLWTVGLSHLSPNRTVLRRGWKAFAEGNSLKLDDECTFELVSWGTGKFCMLQVHINRSVCPSTSSEST